MNAKNSKQKPLASAKETKEAAQQRAQKYASRVYERSTDLEVLVRHKSYKPTVKHINDLQKDLNRLRPVVRSNLTKRKDRPQWEGLQQDNFGRGFILGFITGVLVVAALLLYYNSSARLPFDSAPRSDAARQ